MNLPDVDQETQRQLEKTAAAYLERFSSAHEKLWAAAALTRACRRALIPPLTPVVQNVIASPPSNPAALLRFAAETNAVLSYIGAAIYHPLARKECGPIAGSLKTMRSTHCLYVQTKNSNDISKVYRSVVPIRSGAGAVEASCLQLMEAPHKEGRSTARIL